MAKNWFWGQKCGFWGRSNTAIFRDKLEVVTGTIGYTLQLRAEKLWPQPQAPVITFFYRNLTGLYFYYTAAAYINTSYPSSTTVLFFITSFYLKSIVTMSLNTSSVSLDFASSDFVMSLMKVSIIYSSRKLNLKTCNFNS